MNLGDVLFATDFSTASQRAGIAANGLAQQWGSRLHIVHVVPRLIDPGDSADRLKRLVAEADERLRMETALLSGRVAQQIICYARDKRIGLIVLGTHGRTGVSHALLGSVAESVVRLAPCPVLSVPATAGEAGNLVPPAELTSAHRCIVCVSPTEDLICETCWTRIRAEALEQKRREERPGRRGASV
jgi:nucleotide-binding universal stress UspA family protein